MKKKDAAFWALAVSFIFGVALHWPLWLRLLTIVLSGEELAQVAGKVIHVYLPEG